MPLSSAWSLARTQPAIGTIARMIVSTANIKESTKEFAQALALELKVNGSLMSLGFVEEASVCAQCNLHGESKFSMARQVL